MQQRSSAVVWRVTALSITGQEPRMFFSWVVASDCLIVELPLLSSQNSLRGSRSVLTVSPKNQLLRKSYCNGLNSARASTIFSFLTSAGLFCSPFPFRVF